MKQNRKHKILTGIFASALTLSMTSGLLMMAGCASEVNAEPVSVSSAASGSLPEEEQEDDLLLTAAGSMLRTNISSDENGKDETVYVLSDADGQTEQIIVSEHLKNGDKADALTDETSLTDIENTKGDETYTENADGTISWDAHGNDIFYRGTSDAELPMEVSVSYTLDNKPVQAEDLAGADGHLGITFHYQNRQTKTVKLDGKNTTLEKPCIAVSGLILDLEKAQNISVEGGKVIDDGSRAAAVGLAMPGMRQNLDLQDFDTDAADKLDELFPEQVHIEADISDFSLLGTVTLVSYDVSSLLDMDTDDFEGSVRELNDSADALTEGVAKLEDGEQEISGYLQDLYDGSRQLEDGTSAAADGARTLDAGAGELSAGAQTLSSGIAAVNSGAKELSGHFNELEDGTRTLGSSLQQLRSGADALAEGIGRLSAGAESLREGSGTLSGGLSELSASVSGLPAGSSSLLDGGKALAAALKSGDSSDAGKYGIYEAVQAMGQGAEALSEALQAIMQGSETISEKCLSLANGAKSGDAAQPGIYEAAELLESGLNQAAASLSGSLQEAAGALQNASASDAAAFQDVQSLAGSLQTILQNMTASGELTPEQAGTIGSVVSEDALAGILTEIGTSQAITEKVQQSLSNAGLDTTQITEVLSAIKTGADQIAEGARQLSAGAKSGSTEPAQYGIYEAAAAANEGACRLAASAQKICSTINTMTGDKNLGALVSGLETLDTQSRQLTKAVNRLSDGASALYGGAQELASGTQDADAGAKKLAGGVQQIEAGSKSLLDGVGALADGSRTLSDGTQALADGGDALSSGAQSLKDGTGRLADGFGQLTEGTGKLTDGAQALTDGSRELTDGIRKLDEEGISKIAGLMGEDVNKLYDRVKAVLDYAKEQESFGGCADGVDCTVQYIYKTGQI